MIVDQNSALELSVHNSTDFVVVLKKPGKSAEEWRAGPLPTNNLGRHQVVVIDRRHHKLVAELKGEPERSDPSNKAVGPNPQVTLLYWVR
jgi:hypothetical protein